jgi:dihydroxyacid dehydratase/phosphogluconate dehydratase
MGLTLPGLRLDPAPDSRHSQMATLSGKRIVEMVWEDLLIRDVVDQRAIDNAVITVLALGGSTNAIVHLIATARRASVPLDLERFDALARRTPVLTNVRPSGKYLMEDFYYAGGLRGLLSRLTDLPRHVRADHQRPHARAEPGRRRRLQRRRDPHPREPARGARRPGRSARKSRARRRGDQARRDGSTS